MNRMNPIEFVKQGRAKKKTTALDGRQVSELYREIISSTSDHTNHKKHKHPHTQNNSQTYKNLQITHKEPDKPIVYTCSDCDLEITISAESDFLSVETTHLSSISHQLLLSRPKPRAVYALDKSNKGYTLLEKQGWQHGQSLGLSETGRMYPLKAVSKNDRLGIGSKMTNQIPIIPAPPISHKKEERKRQAILNYLKS